MSAVSLKPLTQRRHRAGSASRGRRSRPTLAHVLLGLILSSVAGCASDARGTANPMPSPPPSPSVWPTPQDEQGAVLAQYRKFWATLTPVSRMPAAQRQAVLAEVAVDPALKSILAGFAQADTKRQVLYGQNLPRPTLRINPDATIALVDDCQDSRRAGVADKPTGRAITQGVERNHVSVTMKKQPGAVWKVAYVDYTKTQC